MTDQQNRVGDDPDDPKIDEEVPVEADLTESVAKEASAGNEGADDE